MKQRVIKHDNGDFSIDHSKPDWDGLTHKPQTDIDILNEIIRDAKQRIALYKQLDKGLWASIFRTDNSEPIREEEKLIEEWQRMITEIEIWTSRYDNQK